MLNIIFVSGLLFILLLFISNSNLIKKNNKKEILKIISILSFGVIFIILLKNKDNLMNLFNKKETFSVGAPLSQRFDFGDVEIPDSDLPESIQIGDDGIPYRVRPDGTRSDASGSPDIVDLFRRAARDRYGGDPNFDISSFDNFRFDPNRVQTRTEAGNVLNETTEILSQIRGNVTDQIDRVNQLSDTDLGNLDINQLSDMLQNISIIRSRDLNRLDSSADSDLIEQLDNTEFRLINEIETRFGGGGGSSNANALSGGATGGGSGNANALSGVNGQQPGGANGNASALSGVNGQQPGGANGNANALSGVNGQQPGGANGNALNGSSGSGQTNQQPGNANGQRPNNANGQRPNNAEGPNQQSGSNAAGPNQQSGSNAELDPDELPGELDPEVKAKMETEKVEAQNELSIKQQKDQNLEQNLDNLGKNNTNKKRLTLAGLAGGGMFVGGSAFAVFSAAAALPGKALDTAEKLANLAEKLLDKREIMMKNGLLTPEMILNLSWSDLYDLVAKHFYGELLATGGDVIDAILSEPEEMR